VTTLKSFAFQIFVQSNLQFTCRRGRVDVKCACGAGTLWAFDGEGSSFLQRVPPGVEKVQR
jgi:hypothetical protein